MPGGQNWRKTGCHFRSISFCDRIYIFSFRHQYLFHHCWLRCDSRWKITITRTAFLFLINFLKPYSICTFYLQELPMHVLMDRWSQLLGNIGKEEKALHSVCSTVPTVSQNCLFEGIKCLQCYKWTRRYSHIPFHAVFSIVYCQGVDYRLDSFIWPIGSRIQSN